MVTALAQVRRDDVAICGYISPSPCHRHGMHWFPLTSALNSVPCLFLHDFCRSQLQLPCIKLAGVSQYFILKMSDVLKSSALLHTCNVNKIKDICHETKLEWKISIALNTQPMALECSTKHHSVSPRGSTCSINLLLKTLHEDCLEYCIEITSRSIVTCVIWQFIWNLLKTGPGKKNCYWLKLWYCSLKLKRHIGTCLQ